MVDEQAKKVDHLKVVPEETTTPEEILTEEEKKILEEEEAEFRALRRDVPGAKGASDAGMLTISVGKQPSPKNVFYRTHPKYRPVFAMVNVEVGMEKQYFAVTADMEAALVNIGITTYNHALYLTITSRGAVRVVPVRCAGSDGVQNEYNRTKEIGLIQGMSEWVRLYTDLENGVYKVFSAPAGRFAEPVWPALKPAKIFRLAFREKGRLIDSVNHALFQRWAARDKDAK